MGRSGAERKQVGKGVTEGTETETKTTGRSGAYGAKGGAQWRQASEGGTETGTGSRGGADGARGGAEASKRGRRKTQRPGPEVGAGSRAREGQRALLGDYSEDDEGGANGSQARQPTFMKEKTHYHELDIDMQLKDVSPKHEGSSLRLSISNDEFIAAPNQAAASRLDAINLVETTPASTSHKSPKKETTTDTHSAKRGEEVREKNIWPPPPQANPTI